MVAITNYSSLVSAISATAEDDGQEFLTFIPTAISIAHDTLIRELDLPDLEKTVTGNLTFQNNRFNKPVDYRFADFLTITVDNKKIILRSRQHDFMVDYWPDNTVTGTPKYYSDVASTQFMVAPTPDSPYAYELRYTGSVDMISPTTATNYFTDRCPSTLFYCVMAEMSRFMKAWTQVDFWTNKYIESRDAWNVEMFRKRRDSGETPNNPTGPNTLKHTIKTNA